MSILFGHPGGNPNSHQAALSHFEAGRLEAFCVPWMPTPATLRALGCVPGLRTSAARLERRWFPPLAGAPKVQGRLGEWSRLIRRSLGHGDKASHEANDWLMRTMLRECRRPAVTAVHAYEDCSLWQFEEAKRLGKACTYDMPIGYYPWWEQRQVQLLRQYSAWLPPSGSGASRFMRPDQKRREMELADLVLVPSTFVRRTIQEFIDKKVALAPYGVDLDFWHPISDLRSPISDLRRSSDLPTSISHLPASGRLRFLYAGQCNLRKGIPVLLEAWRAAELKDAELELVGSWELAPEKQHELPPGVRFFGPLSREELRVRYHAADVFVFPSFFEGFGLVVLEAMACGLPVIATDATAGPDVLDESTGRVFTAGDVEALIAALCWFNENRDQLPAMKRAARAMAERFTWERYRECVRTAVAPFV